MHGQVTAARIPLELRSRLEWSPTRRAEPLTVGVPLPAGLVSSPETLGVSGSDGRRHVSQVRALDRWSDGSVRWALVDLQVDAGVGADDITLVAGPAEPSRDERLRVRNDADGVEVVTGPLTAAFKTGGAFPVSHLSRDGDEPLALGTSGLELTLAAARHQFRISSVEVREAGPLRVELWLTAAPVAGACPIEVAARVELFAGSPAVRVALRLRNPQPARHAGGRWPLGDPGSVMIDAAVVRLALAAPADDVRYATEWGEPLQAAGLPLEIHQESSGGEHWNAPVHRDRTGEVPLRFRGYRCRAGDDERHGHRASPIVQIETARGSVCVTLPEFWQHAPRAITVEGADVVLGLFPGQHGSPHELQGGEQKTHEFVLCMGPDPVSDLPLAWCHDPQFRYPSPDWCCRTGAVPWLSPPDADDPAYASLVALALDDATGFAAKREQADEYGWRHYGDLPADHESAFQTDGRRLVSHYNNQYDAAAAFGFHFLRSGDARWWRLMRDLVRHVRDIDIYHTADDKAAYAGGLFWHTYHYVDAGTATHRTYSTDGPASGGPSAEHNYNLGLMLHYFMTGDRESRDAAIDLGRWVIRMDDGRRTPLRWLAPGSTGLASASGTRAYHGPGRGPANSVLACLVAGRLSGDPAFGAKAEELIARCIGPADDIQALDLLDAERRWYYTVFLQVLGDYLGDKIERGECDAAYAHARASLLHYARWMVTAERPYLDHPDRLEYPNETWAAQDLRKADALYLASWLVDGDERETFRERAGFFHRYGLDTLGRMPTTTYTRPLVLLLRHGLRPAWFARYGADVPAPPQGPAADRPARRAVFRPQRSLAVRRAGLIGVAALIGGVLATILR